MTDILCGHEKYGVYISLGKQKLNWIDKFNWIKLLKENWDWKHSMSFDAFLKI